MNQLTSYWLYIKIGLIVLLCGICSLGTYNYQKNYYEKKLLEIRNAQSQALLKAAKTTIEKERINQETTQTLETKYLEASKKLSVVTNAFDKYRSVDGRMYTKPTTCVSEAGSANSSASNTASEGSKPAKQLCELPRVFADTVVATAIDADEMRARLSVCLDYAASINKQREEMMKEDK